MKPIKFKEMNCTYAENQPEYLPLPAYKDFNGEVISCWSLSLYEKMRILLTGKLWITVLTFNKSLQPICTSIDCPFAKTLLKKLQDFLRKGL